MNGYPLENGKDDLRSRARSQLQRWSRLPRIQRTVLPRYIALIEESGIPNRQGLFDKVVRSRRYLSSVDLISQRSEGMSVFTRW